MSEPPAPGRAPAEHLYWARTKSEAKPVEHKPLDPAAAAALQSASQERSGAAWNKASTWEEKDVSKWAHALLKDDLLMQLSAEFSPDASKLPGELADATELACRAYVTSVPTVSGDVTYIYSRGKQRVVFELKLKLKFELEVRAAGQLRQIVTGELSLPELANDDVDESKMPSPKVTCDQKPYSPLFQSGMQQCWPSLQAALRALVEQAKAKWG